MGNICKEYKKHSHSCEEQEMITNSIRSGRFMLIALLYLAVLTAPFEWLPIVYIGNHGIQLSWFFILAFVYLSMLYILGGQKRFYVNNVSIAAFWWLIAISLSLLGFLTTGTIQHISDFFTTWLQAAMFTLSIIFIYAFRLRRKTFKNMLRIAIFLAVLVSIYALYQQIAIPKHWPLATLPFKNFNISKYEASGYVSGFLRPGAIFVEPVLLGNYLAPLIAFLGSFLVLNRSSLFSTRFIDWLSLGFLSLSFLLTFSLGGYLSLLLVIPILWRSANRESRSRIVLYSVIIILIFGLADLSDYLISGSSILTNVIERFGALVNDTVRFFLSRAPFHLSYGSSTVQRLHATSLVLKIWLQHPVFGIGLNNLGNIAPQIPAGAIGPALVLAQTGLVGAIGYFALLWNVWRELIWAAQFMRARSYTEGEAYAIALRMSFWVLLFGTLTSVNLISSIAMIYFSLAVAMISLCNQLRKEE